jgi:hypothetical protein
VELFRPTCTSSFGRLASEDLEELKNVFDTPVDQILNRQDFLDKIAQIFSASFNFDLVKASPLALISIVLKSPGAAKSMESFLLARDVATTQDVFLLLAYLCQTRFGNEELREKLSGHPQMKSIMNAYQEADKQMPHLGYFDLSETQTEKIRKSATIVEQIRLRRFSESDSEYSVALNHLLNELHAICRMIDANSGTRPDYRAPEVQSFLIGNGVPHPVVAKVRNLFDRRNKTPVSHPGTDSSTSWNVVKNEYDEYRKAVGECLSCIL